LQEATEEDFVQNLLADQPFVPAYFPYNVELNRKGAAPFKQSVSSVELVTNTSDEFIYNFNIDLWIVDVRKEAHFKEGHVPHSINLMIDGKFETWLGSIIKPSEQYYLAGADEKQLQSALERAAAIGYESSIAAAFVVKDGKQKEAEFDIEQFKKSPDTYTIVDVRNTPEVKDKKIFNNSISIPLAELRERVNEIPTAKPVVVHCAGGYRSAAASSLLHSKLNGKVNVFDLSEVIKQF
jgi:hydroxyacylglutathione hydrolase